MLSSISLIYISVTVVVSRELNLKFLLPGSASAMTFLYLQIEQFTPAPDNPDVPLDPELPDEPDEPDVPLDPEVPDEPSAPPCTVIQAPDVAS